jgi:DNA-directed RNA polymerase specialized sigma24 family protein
MPGEPPRTWAERQREMHRLRTEDGLTLREIGTRFGVGPERVRQLINRHIHQTTGAIPNPGQLSRTAAEIRRQAELARAQEHAVELLAAWRDGFAIQQLAQTFGLRVRCVRQAIHEIASKYDRLARDVALRKPPTPPI